MTATSETDYSSLVGREFPGGRCAIEDYKAWLMADALGDDPYDPTPHPVLAWMTSVAGMGLSWDELFAWFGATAADGPMFGEHRTVFHGELTCDDYQVTGRITSVDRKSGRRAGVFDIVGYELELRRGGDEGGATGGTGELVATCWNSLILPRGGAA